MHHSQVKSHSNQLFETASDKLSQTGPLYRMAFLLRVLHGRLNLRLAHDLQDRGAPHQQVPNFFPYYKSKFNHATALCASHSPVAIHTDCKAARPRLGLQNCTSETYKGVLLNQCFSLKKKNCISFSIIQNSPTRPQSARRNRPWRLTRTARLHVRCSNCKIARPRLIKVCC